MAGRFNHGDTEDTEKAHREGAETSDYALQQVVNTSLVILSLFKEQPYVHD